MTNAFIFLKKLDKKMIIIKLYDHFLFNKIIIMYDDCFDQLTQYYHDIRQFKTYFIKHCHVEKKCEAFKIWTHWLTRNLNNISDNYHLIPNSSVTRDTEILTHLQDKGVGLIQAQEFYDQVIHQVLNLYQLYHHSKRRSLSDDSLTCAMSHKIKYSTDTLNGMKYHIYQFGDMYIKHLDVIHAKLMRKYQGSEDCRKFYLFEVGFNYYILGGYSLQWCLSNELLHYLHTSLMVRTELFASPINAVLPLYCSLFIIDRHFGAMDNFFNLIPEQNLEGTFELNPPFVEKIVIRITDSICHFMTKSQAQNKDLMFIYFMPNWLDSRGYQQLINSSFMIDEIILLSGQHHYIQSHCQTLVGTNFNTHIMIVGTNKAKQRWTPIIRDQIIQLFDHKS